MSKMRSDVTLAPGSSGTCGSRSLHRPPSRRRPSSSGGRGAPRTATHRSIQTTSANIAYAEGEVLRVGADAVIVLHHVVVVEDDQRDQPREPPAGWQRAPRKRLLLSLFKPTQQPREVRGARAAAPSVALETSWIVVLRPSHKPPPGNRGAAPMYKS